MRHSYTDPVGPGALRDRGDGRRIAGGVAAGLGLFGLGVELVIGAGVGVPGGVHAVDLNGSTFFNNSAVDSYY